MSSAAAPPQPATTAAAAAAAAEVARKRAAVQQLVAEQAQKRKDNKRSFDSSSDEDSDDSGASSDSEPERPKAAAAASSAPRKRAKPEPAATAPRVKPESAAAAPRAARPEPASKSDDEDEASDEEEEEEEAPKATKQAKTKSKPASAAAAAASRTKASAAPAADKVTQFITRSVDPEEHPFITRGEVIPFVSASGESIRVRVKTLGYTIGSAHPRYFPYGGKTKRLPSFQDPDASFKELNFGTVRLGPGDEEIKDSNESWVQITAELVYRFTCDGDAARQHCKDVLFRDEMGKSAVPPSVQAAREDKAANDQNHKLRTAVFNKHKDAALLAHNIAADPDGMSQDPQPMLPWAIYNYYSAASAGKRGSSAAAATAASAKTTSSKSKSAPAAAAAVEASSASAPVAAVASLSPALAEIVDEYIQHDREQTRDFIKNATTTASKVLEKRFAVARLMSIYVLEPRAQKQSQEVRFAVARTLLAFHPEAHKLANKAIEEEVAKEDANALSLATTEMED